MISQFYIKQKQNIQIHVFKTNINNDTDVKTIGTLLNSNPYIKNWSVDLEDIDRVLRIEARKQLHENDIVKHLNTKGFYCAILE
ncbi:hypothetical protein [Psychroserpens sp. SPM9]|uniref:hypothetical protein n=1 Tax=Psychroserpens sp. SPM9 TaxID=2975598 RepID=UPI0021A86921|nr:hypothetical protein [Psychroserpens sp. SPM9]MDG5492056.1 hypothetical protein [Psychroserpens sp. SPM9]